MRNTKLEKVIFILLKVFGILTILGAFLSKDSFYSKEGIRISSHTKIIGNLYTISPIALIGMIVSIIIYLLLIKFIAKHISISRKSN